LAESRSQDQFSTTAPKPSVAASPSCDEVTIKSPRIADTMHQMTSTIHENGNVWKMPLQISAEKGYDRSVRALLDSGANVNAVSCTGLTALHLAAKNGHVDMIEMLLKDNANIDVTDEDGWTALHYAANNDCEVVVRLQIRRGADLNAKARDRDCLRTWD